MSEQEITPQDNILIKSVVIGIMAEAGMPIDSLNKCRVEIIHPHNWEVALYVPCVKGLSVRNIKSCVEEGLFKILLVEEECCDYLGRNVDKNYLVWYFRHPKVPQSTYARLEAEIEMALGNDVAFEFPKPSGIKSKSEYVFMTLKEEFYAAIENGDKDIEYRNFNQYYCDKFFSPGVKKKYIRFNRGYKSGKENQMVFAIDYIMLLDNQGHSYPAIANGKLITSLNQLPPGFVPAMYGIRLRGRVS